MKNLPNLKIVIYIGGSEAEVLNALFSDAAKMSFSVKSLGTVSDRKTLLSLFSTQSLQEFDILTLTLSGFGTDMLQSTVSLLYPHTVVITSAAPFLQGKKKHQSEVISSIGTVRELLPSDGRLILNKDDPYLKKILKRKKAPVIFYSERDVYKVYEKREKTIFTTDVFGTSASYETSLLTLVSVDILIPFMLLLKRYGFTESVARECIRYANPTPGYLVRRVINGITCINFTAETNISKLTSLISYCDLYQGNKILVLDAEYSPGTEDRKYYQELGKRLTYIFDYLFLIPTPRAKLMKHGFASGKISSYFSIESPQKMHSYLVPLATEGDLVIFFGKEVAEIYTHYMRYLLHKS